jgi:3-oxoacyl-[acyl-carrier protein] reductase
MDLQLGGKGVLVTGAGGFLGSAIAAAFAAEGAAVAVHHRDERDRATAEKLAAATGGVVLRADLSLEHEADALVPDAARALGRLDVCVANAGRFPQEDVGLRDMPLDRWRTTLDDNLLPAFLTTRAYLRHVAESAEVAGSLVLVGSASGWFGHAGRADYASAKGAILTGLLLSAKNEMAAIAPGGRVNAVMPGWITTPERLGDTPGAVVADAVATQALPRLGSPDHVAATVVWLSSPAAAHVTGAVVPVSGGMEGRLLHRPAPVG